MVGKHLSADGKLRDCDAASPASCKAKGKDGGPVRHFESQKHFEKEMTKEMGTFPKKASRSTSKTGKGSKNGKSDKTAEQKDVSVGNGWYAPATSAPTPWTAEDDANLKADIAAMDDSELMDYDNNVSASEHSKSGMSYRGSELVRRMNVATGPEYGRGEKMPSFADYGRSAEEEQEYHADRVQSLSNDGLVHSYEQFYFESDEKDYQSQAIMDTYRNEMELRLSGDVDN